ncbi:MAG: gamma-glutamyl-gamma-aminobutyrate hydrolase family protein [Planctomycetes bacterium]|nr:gamma-glutamyl-gamma-aminobutyrate hydrolase family protein [Planctomycetota bacterium]
MPAPLIGITSDNKDNADASNRYESPVAYARAVAEAGGVPVILPQEAELADEYVRRCDGILMTGGADPRTEAFGAPTHAAAKVMAQRRQTFDLSLLAALDRRKNRPTLGVCLGMQLMSLHAGGKINQHLPDTLGDRAAQHQKDNRHAVVVRAKDSVLGDVADASVVSWHHQAVADPGRLRLVATAPDGVIEAVDDPARAFYLGVQWHPERGGDGPLNAGLIRRFLDACRSAT